MLETNETCFEVLFKLEPYCSLKFWGSVKYWPLHTKVYISQVKVSYLATL
jgi:hypothetical protein